VIFSDNLGGGWRERSGMAALIMAAQRNNNGVAASA